VCARARAPALCPALSHQFLLLHVLRWAENLKTDENLLAI
jgi:hypothetical protein